MNLKDKVKQYIEYCEYRKELDSKTLKAYCIDLKQYFNYVQTEDMNKEKIENYITELHKKYKQKTVKRKLASIKAFYNFCEEELIIETNPFKQIKVKFKEMFILPRIISREDIECLLNYMYKQLKNTTQKKYKYYLRDTAIIEILFATGARVYEISNIQSNNINLNTGLICFMGKGGKERYIQISNNTILMTLRQYYFMNKREIQESGFFFVNRNGKRFTEQSIRYMLKKYSNEAGILVKITPHMFRHSVATYLIEDGVDLSCVQHILGHSSVKTTQIYIHVATKKQAEILRLRHPRNFMKISKVS